MDSPLIKKMEQFTAFSDEDRTLLNDLVARRQRHYNAREDIIAEGEKSADIHIVVSGLACRYKLLEDGRRQIMAFLVPGDPCDPEIFILQAMDHTIGTLAPSMIASISGTIMKDLLLNRAGIALAFWWNTLQDEGVLRERIIDEGRRDAYARLAFLIYEVFLRMRAVGIIDDANFAVNGNSSPPKASAGRCSTPQACGRPHSSTETTFTSIARSGNLTRKPANGSRA